MNKHKKFIKDAYDGKYGSMCREWKDTILEHYPEFEEAGFKVGDWIRLNSDFDNGKILICISNYQNKRAYGFKYNGDWCASSEYNGWTFKDCPEKWRKATREEVEERLIAEVKRRGYQSGCMIVSLGDCYEISHCKRQKGVLSKEINFDYDGDIDALWADVLIDGIKDSLIVYEKGQWADIINTMTKKEAEEKFGCKII